MHDRSFAELDAAAARAAAVLASVGVRRGDVVLLLMSRELEWWDLMLGCIRIGAIASPGTVQSTAKDIAYRATAAKARDRKRAVSGKSVSVSVDIGGRRDIKKKMI